MVIWFSDLLIMRIVYSKFSQIQKFCNIYFLPILHLFFCFTTLLFGYYKAMIFLLFLYLNKHIIEPLKQRFAENWYFFTGPDHAQTLSFNRNYNLVNNENIFASSFSSKKQTRIIIWPLNTILSEQNKHFNMSGPFFIFLWSTFLTYLFSSPGNKLLLFYLLFRITLRSRLVNGKRRRSTGTQLFSFYWWNSRHCADW